jgi:hypothetical protein
LGDSSWQKSQQRKASGGVFHAPTNLLVQDPGSLLDFSLRNNGHFHLGTALENIKRLLGAGATLSWNEVAALNRSLLVVPPEYADEADDIRKLAKSAVE